MQFLQSLDHVALRIPRHLQRMAARRRGLDAVIPRDVGNDEFFKAIRSVAAAPTVRTALEIGSSSGAGSTRALVAGLSRKVSSELYCLELSLPRFKRLQRRYRNAPWVTCIRGTSARPEDFVTPTDVAEYFHQHPESPLQRYGLQEVLRWRAGDLEYAARQPVAPDGIDIALRKSGREVFDLVLIDGSQFTGAAELDRLYGADYILLDDTLTLKNHANYVRLSNDPKYVLMTTGPECRNGFAAFRAASAPRVDGLDEK